MSRGVASIDMLRNRERSDESEHCRRLISVLIRLLALPCSLLMSFSDGGEWREISERSITFMVQRDSTAFQGCHARFFLALKRHSACRPLAHLWPSCRGCRGRRGCRRTRGRGARTRADTCKGRKRGKEEEDLEDRDGRCNEKGKQCNTIYDTRPTAPPFPRSSALPS